MNWLTSNLIPAWNDPGWTAYNGASIDNEKIALPTNSRVKLLLDKGGIIPGSSYIKLKVTFYGTFNDDYDYSPTSSIDFKIVYLDNTVQTGKILLSRDKVVDNKYIDETIVQVELKNIRSMEIYFNNYDNAPGTLYVSNVELYKSEDINKEQVVDAVAEAVSLKKCERYNNGLIIEWKGDVKPLKCVFISDENNDMLGILVDDVDFISTPRIYADLE